MYLVLAPGGLSLPVDYLSLVRAPALFLTLSLPTRYCATRKALPVYSEIRYPITWFRSFSIRRTSSHRAPMPMLTGDYHPDHPDLTPKL